MPKRNFRYMGSAQTKSLSDGSGIAELYDIYASRRASAFGYPYRLEISSDYDVGPNYLPSGGAFGIAYTFVNYYAEEQFTISLNFNGTATSSDFVDTFGISFTPSVNPQTGIVQVSYTNLFRTRSGAGGIADGATFSIQLTNSLGDVVHTVLLSVTNGQYTLTPNSSSYNEGQQVSFTLTYSNAPPSESIFYAFTPYSGIGGTVIAGDVSSTVTGSFISSSTGSGTQNITGPTLTNDFTTEGTETVVCRVAHYTTSYTVSYYLAEGTVNINDTSQTPAVTISPPGNFTLNEGTNQTFNFTTTGFPSGSLDYEIVLSVEAEGSDINVPLTGSITISGSSGSLSITPTSDGYTETGQTETFYINIFHPNGLGSILATSGVVTIGDTSTGVPEPAGIDITTNFYEYSNRHIDSDTYMGNSSDYTGPYDVADVQQGGFTGTGRVYLVHKTTSATTFYSDAPIAAVQILDAGGTTVLQEWVFNTSVGGTGSTWQTGTSALIAQTVGIPVAPSAANAAVAWAAITTGTSTTRMNWASATGSSYTGAADGIATPSGPMPVGNGTINQSSGAYYMYHETSGATRYQSVLARSPTYSFSGGERIRIAHALTGYSVNPQDPDESLWVGVGP